MQYSLNWPIQIIFVYSVIFSLYLISIAANINRISQFDEYGNKTFSCNFSNNKF